MKGRAEESLGKEESHRGKTTNERHAETIGNSTKNRDRRKGCKQLERGLKTDKKVRKGRWKDGGRLPLTSSRTLVPRALAP